VADAATAALPISAAVLVLCVAAVRGLMIGETLGVLLWVLRHPVRAIRMDYPAHWRDDDRGTR
jgi:hypothetical protein